MKNGKPVIYWDTCVFIAWLKDETLLWPKDVMTGITQVFDMVGRNEVFLITSALTRTEIYLADLTLEQKLRFADILRRRNVDEPAADFKITDRASEIRYGHNIKTPDAIHIATATIRRADEMHTMDGLDVKTGKCNSGILKLNGKLKYKLFITPPYPRLAATAVIPPRIEKDDESDNHKQPKLLFEEPPLVERNEVNNEQTDDLDPGTGDQENHKLETDTAHPNPVQGSDGGRAQSETAKETIEARERAKITEGDEKRSKRP